MDNNPLNPTTPPPVPPAQPVVPQAAPATPQVNPVPPLPQGLPPEMPGAQVTNPGRKSGKIIMMGIIVVVLLLLGLGVWYFYNNMGSNNSANKQQAVQEVNSLATELESVQITDPSGDLESVNEEITLLDSTPSAR